MGVVCSDVINNSPLFDSYCTYVGQDGTHNENKRLQTHSEMENNSKGVFQRFGK